MGGGLTGVAGHIVQGPVVEASKQGLASVITHGKVNNKLCVLKFVP